MKRLRLVLAAIGFIVVLAIAGAVFGQHNGGNAGLPATSTPTATSQPAAAAPEASGTPGLVIPTPAIPLPKNCPPETAPQVNNTDRYTFCTPVGWGAFNNNNSIALTLLLKPRPGGDIVVQPTDFDRMLVVIALDTGSAPQNAPADCTGPPNDTVDGHAAHHCTAPLDPATNLYHASRAEFWMIDLAGSRKFYITVFVAADASAEDQAAISPIVHNITLPSAQ